jgi:diguanylate cyclase (GGDEF)-like protein
MGSDILVVDDNPAMIQVTARMLTGLGRVRFATSGAAALQKARESTPDLVLLDVEMPEMDGHEVCALFKSDLAMRDVPVIFVTSQAGQESELSGLNAGAVDYIAKPVNPAVLMARVQLHLALKRRADEMLRLVRIDELTEVANRHSFDEMLEREWQRGLRGCDPISLMLIDIDHFGGYVRRHGQPAGDACLRAVAQGLQFISRRPGDVFARVGGKRFALLLPQTPRANAEHLAHNALQAMELLAIQNDGAPVTGALSVSIGLASHDADSPGWVAAGQQWRLRLRPALSAETLLRSAQLALEAAKRNGRGQAWLLDVADLDHPDAAQEISAAHESARYAPA